MEFLKKQNLRNNPALIWAICFVLLSFVIRGIGGTNAAARYASLQAVVDQQTFAIDDYIGWTLDWSGSPSGKKYSNKPPGPLFLTLPLYYLFDRFTKLTGNRKVNPQGIYQSDIGPTYKVFFNFLTKVLPFALFILFLGFTLQKRGYSSISINLLAITSLFGTTASIFMNTFFGHGLASILFMIMFWSWLEKKYKMVGLFYGLTLLSEFAGGPVLLVLVPFLIYENRKKLTNIYSFIIGGIVPGLLWIWYHVSCYGSPFLTSMNFPNPAFVYSKDVEGQLSSMFTLFPRWEIVKELLWGTSRGLLFTQPWVLLLIVLFIFVKFEKKFYGAFAISCLFISIWLNSTFWGWHAGASAGPRYLSIGLSLMPIVAAFIYDDLKKWQKYFLWTLIVVTLLFRIQVYATSILAPVTNLWLWQWEIIKNPSSSKLTMRLILSSILLLGSGYFSFFAKKIR